MGFAWFTLGSVLVAATALLLAASFRLRTVPAFLLAAYLLANAELVAVAEILSPFHAVTRSGYLGSGALVALVAAGVWWARGRPQPPLGELRRTRELRSNPVLLILGGGVALSLVYALVVGLTTPPDTYDALAHQLVRAAAWRQQHSVAPIAGVNDNLGVNASPPNAELQMLFTLVLAGRDTFASIPQFLAECALLVSVFGMARRVGFARDAAAFAALLTGTFAVIALQAATSQDDLIAGAAIAIAGFFLLGRSRTDAILAGLAVGLAFGTKLTVVFAFPAFVLIAIAVGGVRRIAVIVATSLVSFVCFGSFIYVQHASNATTVTSYPAGQGSIRAASSVVDTVSTAARISYDFIDLSGFHYALENTTSLVVVFFTLPLVLAVVIRSWRRPILVAALVPFIVGLLGIVTGFVLGNVHLPLNPPNATSPGHFSLGVNTIGDEIGAFYGPIGTLLLLPLSAWVSIEWLRGRADRRLAALALALPAALLVFSFTLSYNPWAGRYFVGPVALAMPLAGFVYRSRTLARAAALLGVFALVIANIFNADKPIGLADSRPVWSLSYVDAQTLERPKWRPLLRRVAEKVPADAHIGLVLDANDYWSYPFYGPDLTRTVIYLAPTDPRREAANDRLPWIIVHKHPGPWHIIRLGPNGGETDVTLGPTRPRKSRPVG